MLELNGYRGDREIAPSTALLQQLETESQGQLHLPRWRCAKSLTKGRIGLLPGRIENCGGIDLAELRVIEDVVQFPPEREFAPVLPQLETPEQGHVKVLSSGAAQEILGCVSDIASGCEGNAGSVEEPVNSLFTAREVGIAGEIHPLAVRTATATQKIGASRVDVNS